MKKQIFISVAIFIILVIFIIKIKEHIDAPTLMIISICGTIASIIALVHVWIQLSHSITISKASKEASENTRKKILSYLSSFDLGKLLKTIQEIQKYNRHKEYSLSLLRMQELREGMHLIRNNPTFKLILSEKIISNMISTISTDINTIEKQMTSSKVILDINKLNENLDYFLNHLSDLTMKARFKEN